MNGKQISLEVQVINLCTRVIVNGMTAFDKWTPYGMTFMSHCGPYLVEGDNNVELYLSEPDATLPDEEPGYEASFYFHKSISPPDPQHVFVAYRWERSECALSKGAQRRVLKHRFQLRKLPQRWAWQAGRPYEEGERRVLVDQIHALVDAVRRKDTKTILELLKYKISEVAEGMAIEREQYVEELLEELGDVWGEEDYHFDKVDVEQLTLEADYGGRLVHVRQPDGTTPIRCHGGRYEVTLPICFGYVDNAWRIVR